MRLVEAVQLSATFLGILASVASIAEKRLVGRFQKAGATTPESALELPPLRPLTRWRLHRLASARAVLFLGEHRAYFDAAAYKALRKKRIVLVVSMVLVALTIVVLVHLATRG